MWPLSQPLVRPIRFRAGVSLVIIAMALVMLVAFAALALDISQGRLARSQLQIAADAAARAAVWQVPANLPLATADAQTIASANSCLGGVVVLDATQDIEFGKWSTTTRDFTPLSGTALTQANAVRITARRIAARGTAVPTLLASALAKPVQSLDISASATSYVIAGPLIAGGVIGIQSVDLKGTPNIDSYDSSTGPYNPGNPGSNAAVLSNGNVSGNGVPTIHGSVAYGGTFDGKITVTPGPAAPLSSPESFPPVDSSPYQTNNNNSQIASRLDAQRNLSLTGNAVLSVPAGTYYVNNLSMTGNSTLQLNGQVTFYVTGSITLAGTVTTADNTPANLQIMVDGGGAVDLAGTSDLYASLYAPLSAITLRGTHDYYGAMIGNSLSMVGNSAIHADEGLMKYGPPRVLLVK